MRPSSISFDHNGAPTISSSSASPLRLHDVKAAPKYSPYCSPFKNFFIFIIALLVSGKVNIITLPFIFESFGAPETNHNSSFIK